MLLEKLAALLLLASLWQSILLLRRTRLFTWYPRTYLATALLVSMAVASALLAPSWCLPLAVLLLFIQYLPLLRWRRNRLPPGPLKRPDAGMFLDKAYLEKLAVRHGSVFKICTLYHPTVCVTDLEAGWELLALDGLESPPLRFDQLMPGGALRYMDSERHRHYRKVLAKAFTGAVVEQSLPFLQSAVKRTIDSFRSPCPEPVVVLVRDLVEEALLGALLGVERPGPDFDKARRALREIELGLVERELLPWKPATRRVTRALAELAGLIAESQLGPMCKALPESCRKNPTVAHNLAFVAYTACQDLTGLLTWILQFLAREPEWLKVAAPEQIVLETLRLEQSEYLFRRTTRDIEWRDYQIPRGWLIRLCVREAHRVSPIAHASKFWPTRPDPTPYLKPFGAHQHTCPGRKMTLSLASLFVESLAPFSLELLADGPTEFDGWHWRPDRHLKIRLT